MFQGKNYIGEIQKEKATFKAINPSTEQVYGEFPITDASGVHEAVDVARKAQVSWSKESRVRRAEYFDKLAQLLKRDHEKLRDAISIETGKNLNESHAEVIEALHMCQVVAGSGRQPFGEVYGSELSTKDVFVVRKPRGVVVVISPWNFPAAIGAFWCSAPAILEGNTVVHKPSELTPMVNDMIALLYYEAGFPVGVYNLVHGDGTTGSALVRSNVDVILFTGSAEVGQDIRRHCADTFGKTCSIECGSKSATMIFDDGNFDLALDVSVASAFKLSGQRCVSSGRLLIQRNIFEDFCDEFSNRLSKVTFGDPFSDPAPNYGPLISREHRDKVIGFNRMVMCDEDANIISCSPAERPIFGYFLPPFVYACEWMDKPFLKQEVFGPHVALIPFNDLDDAIRIYNDTDYGLALGVVTDDYRKHREIAQRCTAGMIYINGGSIAAESHVPFSSWKKSGYGASASATWKAVTHTTTVTTNFEEGKLQFAQGMKI